MENKEFQSKARKIFLLTLLAILLMAGGAIGMKQEDEQAHANAVLDQLYGTHDPEEIYAIEVKK